MQYSSLVRILKWCRIVTLCMRCCYSNLLTEMFYCWNRPAWHRSIWRTNFTEWLVTPTRISCCSRHRWWRCSFHGRGSRQSVSNRFQLPLRVHGKTLYLPASCLRPSCRSSSVDSRLFFSGCYAEDWHLQLMRWTYDCSIFLWRALEVF